MREEFERSLQQRHVKIEFLGSYFVMLFFPKIKKCTILWMYIHIQNTHIQKIFTFPVFTLKKSYIIDSLEKDGKIFLNRSFTGESFYSRASLAARSAKLNPPAPGIRACLFTCYRRSPAKRIASSARKGIAHDHASANFARTAG